MKILKNKSDNPFPNVECENDFKPFKFICENCNSEIEIETEQDIEELNGDYYNYGCLYVTCPCCGEITETDEYKDVIYSNLEYPQNFTRPTRKYEVVHIEDDEIQKQIKKGIKWLRENSDRDHWYYECGDTFIIIFNMSGDKCYEVYVTNNYNYGTVEFEYEDLLINDMV